jgi:DNA-binding response OmpR family regulator
MIERTATLPGGPPKILVAEDEPNLRKLLEVIIGKEGYKVIAVANGEDAWHAINEVAPDLVLTDIMMAKMDGIELCRRIRAQSQFDQVPILMLTAKDEQLDKYQGFREGADDYLTKPFDPVELVFRIQAHLRRAASAGRPATEVSEIGSLRLDRKNYQAIVEERVIQLTKSEFAILAHLMAHADEIVSSEQLLVEALAYPPRVGNSEIVRTHIRNIRQKVETDPANPQIVLTVARHGYTIKSA